MNLHDIAYPMDNIQLIAEYCSAFYNMEFWVADDRQHVEYRAYVGGSTLDINSRDTLTYTNRALEWRDNGRPPLR